MTRTRETGWRLIVALGAALAMPQVGLAQPAPEAETPPAEEPMGEPAEEPMAEPAEEPMAEPAEEETAMPWESRAEPEEEARGEQWDEGEEETEEEGRWPTEEVRPEMEANAEEERTPWPAARINLNEDGSYYLRFLTWQQVWVRASEMNPGTTVSGGDGTWQGDVAIRRSRYLVLGQFERFQLVMHFGINNQTFNSGGYLGTDGKKPQVYVHDAWASFEPIEGHLKIGAGLLYFNGISRMTNSSTLNYLALDAPILNWPTIELTDQFARQLGVFARAQVAGLDVQVAVNRPFATSAFGGPVNTWNFVGYASYSFLDHESFALPYRVGTYLGAKSVLNVGAGWYWQPDAGQGTDVDIDTGEPERRDHLLFGADVFFDHPFGDWAVTALATYYYFDLGADVVRNIGIANIGDGGSGSTLNGRGNAYPSIGSGHHIYLQAGVALPAFTRWLRLQPYFGLQTSILDAYDDPAVIFDLGANWLFAGHHARLTTHWRSRPIFTDDTATGGGFGVASSRANEFIAQVQLLF